MRYEYTVTTFAGYVCVLPHKPEDAIGPNPRRFPKTCGELHLSAEDAAECCFFANADEPAPDAVRWQVYPLAGIRAPLSAYVGDEHPVVPEGAVTVTVTA